MTTSLQEIKKEFALKFSNWKIHHKTSPCIKDDYVVTEIADWWLSKYESLIKERDAELVNRLKEICNKSKTERGLSVAIGNFIKTITPTEGGEMK